MKVHMILHYWDDEETSGSEVQETHSDLEQARKRLKELAHEEREAIIKDRGIEYHKDFDQDDDELVSYGWYGLGYYDPCVFRWTLQSDEVL